MMKNKTYFKKIRKEYQQASVYNAELYQNMAEKLNAILFGNVIDFGNGGIINYSTHKLDKLICIDIINTNKNTTDNKIDFVYGDFYNIDLDGKTDCVLAQFLLHHLTDDKRLKNSIRKIRLKLPAKGKLILGEIAVPRVIELIQNLLRPILCLVLTLLGKPGLRFFSIQSLCALLSEAGFNDIKFQDIPIGKRVSPAPVLFPRLRISGRLYPFKCILIDAKI